MSGVFHATAVDVDGRKTMGDGEISDSPTPWFKVAAEICMGGQSSLMASSVSDAIE